MMFKEIKKIPSFVICMKIFKWYENLNPIIANNNHIPYQGLIIQLFDSCRNLES